MSARTARCLVVTLALGVGSPDPASPPSHPTRNIVLRRYAQGGPHFVPRPGRKERRSGRERLTQRVRHETLERSRVFRRLPRPPRSIQSTIPRNAPMGSSTRRTRKTSSMTHRVPASWGEGGGPTHTRVPSTAPHDSVRI
jgi:hypothetical protein